MKNKKKQKCTTISIIRDSEVIEEESDDIEIIASDGDITANRCFLQSSSALIRRSLKYNKEAEVLDLQEYSIEVVDLFLKLIYTGHLSCPNKELMEEVLDLTKELEVNLKGSKPRSPRLVKTKETHTKVRQKLIKCLDPECDRMFGNKYLMKNHVKRMHKVLEIQEKPIKCLIPDCEKRFAGTSQMKGHMRRVHKASGKNVSKSASIEKSSRVLRPRKVNAKIKNYENFESYFHMID